MSADFIVSASEKRDWLELEKKGEDVRVPQNPREVANAVVQDEKGLVTSRA